MTASIPILAEAGPGAGKTHAMVDRIVEAMRDLPPYRFLAAITYTRAAANTIRERLSLRVRLKRNVFVGTTHSFVNRFVLMPYGDLLSILPEDRVFAPVDIHSKGRGASRYTENLLNKGIVPYDVMIPRARSLLSEAKISASVCARLAFVFVDEFQDVDINALNVFECFRKSSQTNLYVVGDPEQYVMGFAYRGQKRPKFGNIPFFRFKKYAEVTSIAENYRSNGEIVEFANRFRQDVQQTAKKPRRREPRVLFIRDTSLSTIVETYRRLSV